MSNELIGPHIPWNETPPPSPVPDDSTLMAESASGNALVSLVTNNYWLTSHWQTATDNSSIMKIASIKRTYHGKHCTSGNILTFILVTFQHWTRILRIGHCITEAQGTLNLISYAIFLKCGIHKLIALMRDHLLSLLLPQEVWHGHNNKLIHDDIYIFNMPMLSGALCIVITSQREAKYII